MKQIKVECCGDCPLKYKNLEDNHWFCDHQAVEGMEIFDNSIIHPECPLDDVKEE